MDAVQTNRRRVGRILIVEDDPSIREVLVEFLTLEGYEVHEATTPDIALNLLRKQPVDLVLTDTYEPMWNPALPWLGGMRDAAGKAKLVLLTAYAEAQALVPAEHGLAAVWTKPMDMEVMLAHLEQLLHGDSPDR
jgi:CheY-like chemotaxis protein